MAYTHPDGRNTFRLKPNSNVVVCVNDPPVTPNFEFSTRAPPWVDYFVDGVAGEARAIVMRGESVFLQGYGGTGRTYAARAIVTELLEQKKSVICTSYTHMASQNIAVQGPTMALYIIACTNIQRSGVSWS